MMRFEEDLGPHSTPPKLLLFSHRFSKHELQGGLTPPPSGIATVPFQWEEAPGRPRSTTAPAANDQPPQMLESSRSLSLPPRMFTTNNKVESISSPTTVLDGPDVGTHSSCWVVGKRKQKIKMPLRKIECKESSPVKLSSWRCNSSGDISSKGSGSGSRSSSSLISTNLPGDTFFFISDKTTSSILDKMYESINQAVPWKR